MRKSLASACHARRRQRFDAMRGDTRMTEKRPAIDAAARPESSEKHENNSGVKWSPGAQHIADAVTKRHGNCVSREVTPRAAGACARRRKCQPSASE